MELWVGLDWGIHRYALGWGIMWLLVVSMHGFRWGMNKNTMLFMNVARLHMAFSGCAVNVWLIL